MEYLYLISFVFFILFWGTGLILITKKIKISSLNTNNERGISIIIASKNELDNLKKNLPYWLDLDYSKYELIIIVNNSTDQSYNYLKSIQALRLKVLVIDDIPNEWSAKKYALNQGVLNSKYEYIVFTDADCKPKSNQWLKYYNHSFQKGNEIVIGLSPYQNYSTILNGFIQWETFFTAYLYSLSTILGKPYMCVGRNWGLKKEVFIKENGYKKHFNILSGDDDLFIQNLRDRYKTDILLAPNSQTLSEPKKLWKEYILQKKRHYHVGKYYQLKTKSLLFIFNILQFISFIGVIESILFWKKPILLLTLCFMGLVKYAAINVVTPKIGFKIPLIHHFLGGFLLFLFQLILLPFSFTRLAIWK